MLAPTGTIGFLMDCDTTGIEPDIAIVKYKTLVGGGMMKIVNQTVPEALHDLGYDDERRSAAIIEYIDENDTIEGAPDLKDEHLPIFDCAFSPPTARRSIHYMGHVKMMARRPAVHLRRDLQNRQHAQRRHADEIADAYVEAWKLGLKASPSTATAASAPSR